MPTFFVVFLVSLFLSLGLTPFVKYLSYKYRILDKPDDRKIHAKPVPLMGGIVVFLSFILVLWFVGSISREIIAIGIVGLIFVVFGLVDDVRGQVRARYKIWFHLIFAILFVYLSGISFHLFKVDALNWILTACFITFMTNSMNMLDGMDGLVSGVAFLASLFFFTEVG